jgi:hypothetical protein
MSGSGVRPRTRGSAAAARALDARTSSDALRVGDVLTRRRAGLCAFRTEHVAERPDVAALSRLASLAG